MSLYKLFSCNMEIQYRGCFLSKAMLFTLVTTVLNIILPFIVAYRSRGFWLRSYSFYEQPRVHFTYDYILVAETEDASEPIVCGEGPVLVDRLLSSKEYCADIHVKEHDGNQDGKNDFISFRAHLVIPAGHTVNYVMLILALDYRLKTVCPLHMQSLAIIDNEFSVPASVFRYLGDLQFDQRTHLPCAWNNIDTKYNTSLFDILEKDKMNTIIVDPILDRYFRRDITTRVKTAYKRKQNGPIGTLDVEFHLRVPEVEILYTPSVLQEFKWAWPQYLSLAVVFYWIFDGIKGFVFKRRLLMAWEIVPRNK